MKTDEFQIFEAKWSETRQELVACGTFVQSESNYPHHLTFNQTRLVDELCYNFLSLPLEKQRGLYFACQGIAMELMGTMSGFVDRLDKTRDSKYIRLALVAHALDDYRFDVRDTQSVLARLFRLCKRHSLPLVELGAEILKDFRPLQSEELRANKALRAWLERYAKET